MGLDFFKRTAVHWRNNRDFRWFIGWFIGRFIGWFIGPRDHSGAESLMYGRISRQHPRQPQQGRQNRTRWNADVRFVPFFAMFCEVSTGTEVVGSKVDSPQVFCAGQKTKRTSLRHFVPGRKPKGQAENQQHLCKACWAR